MAINRPFRLKMAKQQGEAFVRDEKITALPIDPFAIAKSRDIDVKPKPDTAGGVSSSAPARSSTTASCRRP